VAIARRQAAAGHLDAALATLDEAVAATGGAPDLLARQCEMLRDAARVADAQAALDRLTEAAPDHPERRALAGELRKHQGDWEGAVALFAEDVAAQPLDVWAHCRLVDALAGLGRAADALVATAAALAAIPENPWLLGLRARMLGALGRFQDAEATLAELAAAWPDHPPLAELRGRLAEQRGDLPAAAAAFAADVARRPGEIWARLRLAGCLGRLGRLDAAIAALAEGLEGAPGNPWLLAERIALLLRAGRLAEADADVTALERAAPGDRRIAGFRALILEQAGDMAGAAAWLARDLDAEPLDGGRRLRLVGLLRRLGDTERALAVVCAPPRPSHAERLAQAQCLAELGRFDMIEDLLIRWPGRDAAAAIGRMQAATRLARARFDHAGAIALARSVLASEPGDPLAAEALQEALVLSFQAVAARREIARGSRRPDGRRGTVRLGSLLGQILNELELDPDLTADLASAALLPGRAQAAHAAELVGQHGQAIGPALALLTGLARAGLLTHGGALADAPAIPRVLHQFWDHPQPPRDVAAMMARAAAANPGLRHQVWNEASAGAFLAGLAKPRLLEAFRLAQPAAAKADLFRLALLHAEGGVWLDPDDWCAAPLLALLPEGMPLVLYQEHLGSIGNNFLAAAPGQKLLAEALHEAVLAVLHGAGETVWLTTGPGLLTRLLARASARRKPFGLPPGISVVSGAGFWAVVRPYRNLAYKSGRRHWANLQGGTDRAIGAPP
jgi:tetratricopeptide (TPR) repeat protein